MQCLRLPTCLLVCLPACLAGPRATTRRDATTGPTQVLAMPMIAVARFLANHRMLDRARPKWRTPANRSEDYVRRLVGAVGAERFHVGAAVARLKFVPPATRSEKQRPASAVGDSESPLSTQSSNRSSIFAALGFGGDDEVEPLPARSSGVEDGGTAVAHPRWRLELAASKGDSEAAAAAAGRPFDAVILACSAEASLRLLSASEADVDSFAAAAAAAVSSPPPPPLPPCLLHPRPAGGIASWRALLAGVRTQPNDVVVHSDPSLMPADRACWAAWNYVKRTTAAAGGAGGGGEETTEATTYWINRLQVKSSRASH